MVEDGVVKTLHITLKYGEDKNQKIITGLKRISKPGLRVYAGKDELPKVLGGLGIAILSTNKGVSLTKRLVSFRLVARYLHSFGRPKAA